MAKRVLYYGCGEDKGHFLWESEWERVAGGYEHVIGGLSGVIDGNFCPSRLHPQQWKKTDAEGWTILAWWDHSVDRRPGSNSTFLFKGFDTVAEMLAAARDKFPTVFARQPAVSPSAEEVSTADSK